MLAIVPSFKLCAAWPEQAGKQGEFPSLVRCAATQGGSTCPSVQGHPQCGKCFHLRCVVPAMSSVPSGDWYCPGCYVLLINSLAELMDSDIVLSRHQGDPYFDDVFESYARSGHA
jgi:hypothetical protein